MTARKGGKIGEADLPGRPLAGVQPDPDRAAARAPEPRAQPKSKRKAGQQAESVRARARPAKPALQITRPIVLVVVGMHRSGTSALGYCLSRVGAGLPMHVVGAGAANERGHWEPEKIIALNDRYLAAAGSGWDDWRQFDPGTLVPHVKAAFVREIKATVKAEYPGQNLLILKDPRISRMIPLYNLALRDAGYDPRYILCIRSPVEVVSSLSDRDGMSESYARLLWLRHMLDAEYATRNLPRTIHQFDALLGDWRESLETIGDELQVTWPRSLDEASEEISGFLDPGLRHHWRGEESFVGPHADWLMRAWDGLYEANSRQGQAELDSVRKALNALSVEIGDQVVAEIYARQNQAQREIALHRDNAERLAAMLRAEMDRAQNAVATPAAATTSAAGLGVTTAVAGSVESDDRIRAAIERAERAEAIVAEINARNDHAESRILRHMNDAALHRGNAVDLADGARAAIDRAQSAETALAAANEKLRLGEEQSAVYQRDADLHRENAERMAGLLREELTRAERAEGFLVEANARVEGAEARILQYVQDAALHRGNAADLAERLRAAEVRIQQLEEQLAEGDQKIREAQASREIEFVEARRLEADLLALTRKIEEHDAAKATDEHQRESERMRLVADHEDLSERYTRIERDHVGLSERHGKVVAEHTALVERHLRLEAERATLAQRLQEAEAQAVDVRQEAATRVAAMELELRAAAERQIKAADEYDRRLREIIVRFADQAGEALRASGRHAADRAALSERLITSEREAARFATLAEHAQRLLSESEAAAAIERQRAEEARNATLEEASRREAGLIEDVSRLRAALAAAEGQHTDLDTALRGIADDRALLQTAVADRTAERDAANDRLREAKVEKEALIQQMGTILLDSAGQRGPAVDRGELEGLRNQVAAIRNSTSWKVTAPLRGVSRLFGRGRK